MKKYRKAIFAVVYSKEKNKIDYLLLKRKLHWVGWEFPKGGIDLFESKIGAVKREIREETGLKGLEIKKFPVYGEYPYQNKLPDRREITGQTFSLFAVRVKGKKVRLDNLEHSDYLWLNFNEAVKKLTWPNQKKCLKIVNEWLKNEL